MHCAGIYDFKVYKCRHVCMFAPGVPARARGRPRMPALPEGARRGVLAVTAGRLRVLALVQRQLPVPAFRTLTCRLCWHSRDAFTELCCRHSRLTGQVGGHSRYSACVLLALVYR